MATATVSLRVAADMAAQEAALNAFTLAPRIQPEMVLPSEVRAPLAYRRFSDTGPKAQFRRKLRAVLLQEWEQGLGVSQAAMLLSSFESLARELAQTGAAVFAGLLGPRQMRALIAHYDRFMAECGSESLLHAYANVAREPSFLREQLRSSLHPLLLALISHAIGGAISLVDGRAKDTGPFEARAQDNMLHIDNTPFNDEYKLLWLWRKGEPKGPAGQNFTFLPGTHAFARNCLLTDDGEAYSTENASVFVTPASLSALASLQMRSGASAASVVEVQDAQPIAVAFAAGSLVHHRYRTLLGEPRSSLILAFHRSVSAQAPLFPPAPAGADLADRCLGGAVAGHHDDHFLEALAGAAPSIAEALVGIASAKAGRHVEQRPITLGRDGIERWLRTVTQAPEIEDIKKSCVGRAIPAETDLSALPRLLARQMMFFDKHGPLDLILYADSREEVRKAARNRIREMSLEDMERRLSKWCRTAATPELCHLMSIEELRAATLMASYLASEARLTQADEGRLLISIERLARDLGEAVSRPYSFQNLLSTSLFIFWALDELAELAFVPPDRIRVAGEAVLRHYLVLALLLERNAPVTLNAAGAVAQ